MNKPATVIRVETAQKIVDVLNEAKIPAFMQVDIIKSILPKLEELAEYQYRRDLQSYQDSLKNEDK